MIVDFHTHILPGVDDGAKNVDESIKILKDCYKKGIRLVVLTPHYYPREKEGINEFLKKREEAYDILRSACLAESEPLPGLRLGCEVNLSADISEYEGIEKLKIEGTDYILLEMPYGSWDENICDQIYKLKLKGFRPVMAHIDRYLGEKNLKSLFDLDLFYQVNADAFLNFKVKCEIAKMFKKGLVHVVGSDVHNMTKRMNNLDKAEEILKSQFGSDYLRYVSENAERMMRNENPHMNYHKYLRKVNPLKLLLSKNKKR